MTGLEIKTAAERYANDYDYVGIRTQDQPYSLGAINHQSCVWDNTMKLQRNSIGQLEAKADISHFGGQYGKGGYLAFHSVAKNTPSAPKWDNNSEAPEAIKAWAEENGYDIEEGKDGYGAYKATLIHRDTQKAIDAAKADYDKMFQNTENGFLRFGDIPVCGKSKNRATGKYEDGVSVFRAEFTENNNYRPILSTPQQEISYLMLVYDNRPVYRVYGDIAGIGGDGEPVIKVNKAILIK